jgi:ABC-type dipeptide/oligopeptide/nickel transport system permease subunit
MIRIAVFVLFLIVALTMIAPWLSPMDPMLTNTAGQLLPPNHDHLLGTDLLGRDVLSRVLYGGRQTLINASLATGIAVSAGVTLGLLARTGQLVDRAVVWLINALLAIPGLVLALVIITLLGRGNIPLAVAVGLSQVAPFGFVVRFAGRTIQSRVYVEAARSFGATQTWINLYHILPNIRPAILAYSGVIFSYCILNVAALSFLGLGGEPGTPDWGTMLADGRIAFRSAPWISIAPGIVISLTVWAVNTLADGVANRHYH